MPMISDYILDDEEAKYANVAGPAPEPPQGNLMPEHHGLEPGTVPDAQYLAEANARQPIVSEQEAEKMAEYIGYLADEGVKVANELFESDAEFAVDNWEIEQELEKIAMLDDETLEYEYGPYLRMGRDVATGIIGGQIKAALEGGMPEDPDKAAVKNQVSEEIARRVAHSLPPEILEDPEAVQDISAKADQAAEVIVEEEDAAMTGGMPQPVTPQAVAATMPSTPIAPPGAGGMATPGNTAPALPMDGPMPAKQAAAPGAYVGGKVDDAGRWIHRKAMQTGGWITGGRGGAGTRGAIGYGALGAGAAGVGAGGYAGYQHMKQAAAPGAYVGGKVDDAGRWIHRKAMQTGGWITGGRGGAGTRGAIGYGALGAGAAGVGAGGYAGYQHMKQAAAPGAYVGGKVDDAGRWIHRKAMQTGGWITGGRGGAGTRGAIGYGTLGAGAAGVGAGGYAGYRHLRG